jgi:hypothetical protein
MKKKAKIECYRNVGDCIAGDQIRVECRTPGKWKLYRRTGQHQGSVCIVKKDAKATILKSYTNIQK